MVAPDAVIGLIEGAGEVGAVIGEVEAVAGPLVMPTQVKGGNSGDLAGLHGHETGGIGLGGELEQYALAVTGAAGGAVKSPGGIAFGQGESFGVTGGFGAPGIDGMGEVEFAEAFADKGGQGGGQPVAV